MNRKAIKISDKRWIYIFDNFVYQIQINTLILTYDEDLYFLT